MHETRIYGHGEWARTVVYNHGASETTCIYDSEGELDNWSKPKRRKLRLKDNIENEIERHRIVKPRDSG